MLNNQMLTIGLQSPRRQKASASPQASTEPALVITAKAVRVEATCCTGCASTSAFKTLGKRWENVGKCWENVGYRKNMEK